MGMTTNEAIECLSERVSIGKTCEQSCMVGFGVNIDTLDEAFYMAISALRKQEQENECVECSGIVYRQTNSGKIIPLGQRCGAKITPPCYVPDGDGCSYQIYGDNNDEPIDRCKSCPLCQSDKVRHKQEHFREANKTLTLDELRTMDGEPVWTVTTGVSSSGRWELCTCETVCACPLHKVLRCVTAYGEVTDYDLDTYGNTWLAYRKKPEEGTD